MKNWSTYLPYALLASGAILLVGFMAWLKNTRGEEVRAKRMPAYKKVLEGMRDSTENQLRQLTDGKMRLFRTSVTGDDVEVTQEQIRVLRSQLSELNRVIEWVTGLWIGSFLADRNIARGLKTMGNLAPVSAVLEPLAERVAGAYYVRSSRAENRAMQGLKLNWWGRHQFTTAGPGVEKIAYYLGRRDTLLEVREEGSGGGRSSETEGRVWCRRIPTE